MKDYLTKLIEKKNSEVAELRAKIKKSEDANEVRALGDTLEALLVELQEAKDQLAKLEDDKNDDKVDVVVKEEDRSGFNPANAMNVLSSAKIGATEARSNDDPRSTMEYRKAFMNYIQRGEINKNVLQFEQRDNAAGTSQNLGVLIPTTVMQEIIKDVDKLYGQLHKRVRKLNVKGGIKYPIGSFSATFKRITEGTVSERQNAGGITGAIEFSYKIGEIRLARTLLQTILSVPVFEEEFSKVIATAYVKAMDQEIMTGVDANNQMEGILTEAAKSSGSRIPAKNIITFSATEMADWTTWQTKLFAQIPLGMRGLRPEFVMTANTYEANIKTLKDDNNRPLYYETFNPVDGTETASFKGHEVVFVENDILQDFNDATDGQYFGMYWVPEEAYAINSNLEFTVVDYFDQETNQYIKKALVINDGKVLKGDHIYLLKKSVAG